MAKITIGGVIEGSLSYAGPRGEQGPQGPQGPQGKQGLPGESGVDGFSPTVTIEEIDGGHTVIITDKDGPHSFDVMDGLIPYEGSYSADARFTEQVFPTSQKTMLDDFTVHAINYTEAPNDYGTTLTIGG